MLQSTSLFLLCLFTSSSLAKLCYTPDGSPRNNTITYQCPTTGAFQESMCCHSIDSSGLSGSDRCVKVGSTEGNWLCKNDDGSLWRRGCSDKSWKSGGCVNVCADSSKDYHGYTMAEYDEQVTMCDDGSLCCGPGSVGADCCNKGNGVFIVNGTTTKQKPPSTSGAVSTATATVTVVASGTAAVPIATSTPDGAVAAPASSNAPKNNASAGNDTGKIVGSVFGGLVVGILIMAIAEFFLFRRMRAKRQEHVPTKDVAESSAGGGVYHHATAAGTGAAYDHKPPLPPPPQSQATAPAPAMNGNGTGHGHVEYWQDKGLTPMYEASAGGSRHSQPWIAELGPGIVPTPTLGTPVAAYPRSSSLPSGSSKSSVTLTPRVQSRYNRPHELASPTEGSRSPSENVKEGLMSPSSAIVPFAISPEIQSESQSRSHSRGQSQSHSPHTPGSWNHR